MSETETLTLTAFLLARIAEDEAWLAVPTVKRVIGRRVYEEPIRRIPSYVARERERWAAECAAKRWILSIHSGGEYGWKDAHLCYDSMTTTEECYTARALASVYSDHPDFNPAWS